MNDALLKETHPQKYYFKKISRMMYYLGMGDCWYESEKTSGIQAKLYIIWQGVSNAFLLIVLLDQILAHFRSDLSEKDKNDLIQFTFAHPLVTCKIMVLYWKKERIKMVMKRLLEETDSIYCYRSLEIERSSTKQCFKSCLMVAACVYMTLITALFDAVRAHFQEGE